jgi:hypothetical protein
MDITEVSWEKVWCPVCYMVVIERIRAMMGCPLGYIYVAGVQGQDRLPGGVQGHLGGV